MSKFEIELIHYLDQEGPVAEIYCDSIQWAEITQKEEEVTVKFYPHPNKEYWEFSCKDAIKILEKTKTKLLIQKNKGHFLERMTPQDPEQVNELAEKLLKEILNHPQKKMIQGELTRFGNVVDIYEPSGRGARYTATGEFLGFLEE